MAARAPAEALSLDIPAHAAHLATARGFVGSVARHFGCPEESVEDLRLAVTEICTEALEGDASLDGIDLRAWADHGSLILEIAPRRGSGALGPPERSDADSVERRRALVSALFPDVETLERDGSPVARISAPCSERA